MSEIEITECQVTPTSPGVRDRDGVHAFARVVFNDAFAIRDIKVIQERDGRFFLGMPSRKFTSPCATCFRKVGVTDQYCHSCGGALAFSGGDGQRTHVDMAHPINQKFRRHLEEVVIAAYHAEVERLRGIHQS